MHTGIVIYLLSDEITDVIYLEGVTPPPQAPAMRNLREGKQQGDQECDEDELKPGIG